MKILFTGATGVLGRRAIPQLVTAGHEVTAVVRKEGEWLGHPAVRPLSIDLFDASTVREAVRNHDAVIHYATSIPQGPEFTKRRAWSMNDRLRAEATRNLVEAGLAGGIELFIQQSVAFVYADGGDQWLDETSPVRPVWDVLDSALAAEAALDRFTASGGRGVVLRLGRLYGQGDISRGFVESVAARKVPIVGDGSNYVSYLHADDAATATLASVSAPAGVYNIADTEPITASEDLATVSGLLKAPAPRRVPYPLALAAVGGAARMLAVSHRVSSELFRRTTGWTPVHRSVAAGWPTIIDEFRKTA
jgi:2-alkyl-3-oxoalkanoate reductase